MKTNALIALATLLAACGSQASSKAPAAHEKAPTAQAAPAPEAAPTATEKAATEKTAQVAEASPPVFPVRYRGNWDYSEDGCDKDESGTRFVITADEIKGYEDTSKLKALETLDGGSDAIRVVLENTSSDGDQTLVQTLRLSPVAGISLRIEDGAETFLAVRCDPV